MTSVDTILSWCRDGQKIRFAIEQAQQETELFQIAAQFEQEKAMQEFFLKEEKIRVEEEREYRKLRNKRIREMNLNGIVNSNTTRNSTNASNGAPDPRSSTTTPRYNFHFDPRSSTTAVGSSPRQLQLQVNIPNSNTNHAAMANRRSPRQTRFEQHQERSNAVQLKTERFFRRNNKAKLAGVLAKNSSCQQGRSLRAGNKLMLGNYNSNPNSPLSASPSSPSSPAANNNKSSGTYTSPKIANANNSSKYKTLLESIRKKISKPKRPVVETTSFQMPNGWIPDSFVEVVTTTGVEEGEHSVLKHTFSSQLRQSSNKL
ncbi:unnamed protein product [Amoebophrya sp. A120]|nr:unnamed protein product [Amoebophrya sp. A120]|eukprot:GSA120T00004636001.1